MKFPGNFSQGPVFLPVMRTPTNLLLILSCLALLPLRAQNTDAGSPPPPPPLEGKHGPMAILSKEERDQVKAAHDKAIAQDPSLKQKMDEARKAMDEARKAMNEAMVKADPTVESILAKIKPPAKGGKWDGKKGERPEPGKHRAGGPGKHPGMANLSESEREQLKGLRERVKEDPAVVAARDAKKNASTPEARRSADEALHKAMHDAMIKADSTISPILEKLRPAPAQQPPQL